MNETIKVSNKSGDLVFEVPSNDYAAAIDKDKGGELFYLLQYDYAKDLLVNNKDADEVIEDLRSLCCVISSELKGEEVYVLLSTVLEDDMIKTYAAIEFGAILQLDADGKLLRNLLDEEKASFSVVDEDEIDNLNLDVLFAKSKDQEYVDPADVLVEASKKEGIEAYGRKDVLEKFAEEKNKSAS